MNKIYRICVVLVICFVKSILGNIDYVYEDVKSKVELQCVQHCPLQNRTDVGHYEYACDYKCNIDQCAKGCKLWRKALTSSCQRICNGTSNRLTSRELYCVMGCNDAIAKYFSELRSRLGIPPAPALLAGSLESTSLKLEWKFPEAVKVGLNCHVQWRYEELAATWQYCRNVTWNADNSNFFVQGLQPYTKYRFRIALNLGHGLGDPILSAQSVVISTLASGVPASPPVNVRAAPMDPHSVSVSWEPGPFPHGPLLSYVVQITDSYPSEGAESAFSEIKDIGPNNTFYIFRNLKSARNYTVDVRMRNNYGPGPVARTLMSTPAETHNTENQNPILIIGTEHSVFELEYMLGEPIHLLHSDQVQLQGIDIHISQKLLFISDDNGSVWRVPIEQETKNKTLILTKSQLGFVPLNISVDWLNDQIYILGKVTPRKDQERYIIKRCNLEGGDLTVAFAGLSRQPTTMQVDPCNGYLFWSIQDYNRGGLYRLDISEISNGIRHEVKVKKISNETDLGAFIIDHTNFRLLVSYQRENTIKAVSLDGQEIINLRPKVANAKLKKVISLATANKKFYWTDGDNVYYEEYYPSWENYFHNMITHLGKSKYKKILINLPGNQPWPVPLNPPTSLQGIFESNIAKIKWQPPHLLGLQGKGAWQNWSYEITVKDTNLNKVMTYKDINTTSYTIANLNQNTEYILKVSAYSKFGQGPWSSEFKGNTLSSNTNPLIFWSAGDGLMTSNAICENITTIIHKSRLRNLHFTDMSWYKDQVYLLTNNSHVYYYNLTSHKKGRLVDIDSVGSIAVDWIGKKLYWSNLKQQLIIRGNLNGTQQEPLPILTLAKELNIDSVKAFLYWSTEYVIECTHLNGVDRVQYHHVELFSGKQVMGLTLDMDQKYVYWIVRGSDGSNLFKAPMAGYTDKSQIKLEKVGLLQKPNMQGPICYFHKHLLWLQDERNAVISDLVGRNLATLSSNSIWGLNMVYVVDNTLRSLPANFTSWEDIIVTPETVDVTSVKVLGSSESFNITWKPIANVNYGTVFYELHIDGISKNNSAVVTNEPTIQYWKTIAPFTRIYVAIRAFTYWATSPQIRAEVYSPPSTPSAPRNLRFYVAYENKEDINISNYASITFRWDPPLFPNGVLQGYKIRCWYAENEVETDICAVEKPANETEFEMTEVESIAQIYFQVQAFTEIGYGIESQQILVNTSQESPIPTLIIASTDTISLDDTDSNQNHSLVTAINAPIEIGLLIREEKLFWINNMQEIFMYHSNTGNKSKIMDIKDTPRSLTIDWLERSLYFSEVSEDISQSTVYKLDLNYLENNNLVNVKTLFSRTANISKIEVSPFARKLYWVETVDDLTFKIMQSNLDGSDSRDFFLKSLKRKRSIVEESSDESQCNCTPNVNVEPTFTLDHSDVTALPSLVFVDSETKDIIQADKNGCICKKIVENHVVSKTYPIKTLKSDFGSLYWTNGNGSLYVFKRPESALITKRLEAVDFLIYGKHTQPQPALKCLTPQQHNNFIATLETKTASSLLLNMPEFSIHENCSNTTMATVRYTIVYKELFGKEKMEDATTFDKVFWINNLKPFSKYAVSIALCNYFTKERDIIVGPPITFQTAPGAPSKPQNVTASVLQPTLARINWLPPEQLNGAVVRYEIHWLTQDLFSRQRGEQPVVYVQYADNSSTLTNLLQKLTPNETYTIWVKAYSEMNETSSESDPVQITTYPEPENLILVNKTSRTLLLGWKVTQHIKEFLIEYTSIASSYEWQEAKFINDNSEEIKINVEKLKPKTHYKFRLSLLYNNHPEWYIWPKDSRFTFETLGDRPSPPGIPIIQYVKPNVYKVVWEVSQENGAPIELYMLEGLKIRIFRDKRSTNANRTAWFYGAPSIEEESFEWESLYNGTDTAWIIDGLSDKYKYAFRVSSLNSFGWSDPSVESNEFDISEADSMLQKQSSMNLIFIATFVPISICLFVVICFAYMTHSGRCSKQKKIQHVMPVARRPDVELATLRELPRRGIHSTNILYVSAVSTPEEITMLPHIRRDQITLTNFLGSGAFGEVYEGEAKQLGNGASDLKVAVKTLKKGASEQEKNEFLQEAQLMSHFKHEHILQLLGVCLDNDPHFIIMELMQGGDLLMFLRNSRTQNNVPSLTLIELLKMCVDVSKGCKYLEEMHFVHRDLACRNCLVSSVERENRIVKIGDFGLARDIYKNDYYRKEGGLLPVKWMAPEALVDGVFTSQSDVWAFGVLLWEIMTLGQQPYQARSNLEVLHYVRVGGRLGKPTDCPDDLYVLMLKCWEFEPENRPTFKYCLEVLDRAHQQHMRNPITAAHSQYISTVPNCISRTKSESEDETNKEQTPFLAQEATSSSTKEVPKYLELVYDPEPETPTLENDGYEIPNQSMEMTTQSCVKPSDNTTVSNGVVYSNIM
ncbi:proto-oncogene tyrosine-protein kinase ROS isoform X2 [Cylas formicarius]|uniref:proto-oncogene tyrosine-protein kinase ROS isoform X2 n=1 Tax=Cylas formicarius TaxID=197179 RepID=UPI0029584A46|nr:proto-oncogene tyrosine-protein kinase ROS isoform X2 [Cylas formicarius]